MSVVFYKSENINRFFKYVKFEAHLARLIVSLNTENSLSLSACREQNMDSWKPGLEFSPLCEGSR